MYWLLVHWTPRNTYYHLITGEEEPEMAAIEAWAKDALDFEPDNDESLWLEDVVPFRIPTVTTPGI
jgi:hypothetical protein